MSERFLIRFNLPHHASEEEARGYLDEFEQIQRERVDRLRDRYSEEIRLLRGKRVLFLGDSLTSDNLGYRTSVSRAAALLATDGSVSGATTATLLPLARRRLDEARYDMISLMLGANDSVTLTKKGRNQVCPDEYIANMEKLLEWARESGTPVLLLAITSVQEERFLRSFSGEGKSQTNQEIAEYNRRLAELANRYGISMQSHWWQTRDEMIEKDGIHLSLVGQEKLSEAWLCAASNLIKEKEV
ncbi:MAG: SGNH/GDSL hydrolase family protein [Clostridia bacterium]|nr:SGNH/GDSL hydrolase family protein [Clostridia bacterium]